MIINKSHAQALIKANLRKLEEVRNTCKVIPAKGKASLWVKAHIRIYDAFFGEKNLLEHADIRHPRTKKLLQVTRYYLWYREDRSADIACLVLHPRKCNFNLDILPVHISQHALIRMTADQLDMTKSVKYMGVSIQILYDNYIWPVGISIRMYVAAGMYALVKTVAEEDTVAEVIVVKTFIRGDKLDAGSEHEGIYNELKENELKIVPSLEEKV